MLPLLRLPAAFWRRFFRFSRACGMSSGGVSAGHGGRGGGRSGSVEVAVRGGSVARGGSSRSCSSSRAGRGGLAAPSGPAPANNPMELDDDVANDADFAAADSSDDDSSSEESVEDENARRVLLLAGVVCTNPATFEAVELQAPTFFASCSVVRAGGFTEVDPLICFWCLRWNLTAPFLRCNRDS